MNLLAWQHPPHHDQLCNQIINIIINRHCPPPAIMTMYKLVVAYDGTRFHGFQRQIDNDALDAISLSRNPSLNLPKKRPVMTNNGTRKHCCITVQEVLERIILQDLYPHQTTADIVCMRFAGRTDKGVHARGQVVSFCVPVAYENTWKLRQAFNSRLPIDISVVSVEELVDDAISFDPRKDAVLKHYSYTFKYQRKLPVVVASIELDEAMIGGPLNSMRHALNDSSTTWLCPWTLDDSQLPNLVQKLQGTHDYSAFVHKSVRHAQNNTLTVTIRYTVLNLKTDYYHPTTTLPGNKDTHYCNNKNNEPIPVDFVTARLDFEATGFRRTMVRNLVGYCVDVCRKRDGVATCEQVLMDPQNSSADDATSATIAIHAAPALGLCLESVSYGP